MKKAQTFEESPKISKDYAIETILYDSWKKCMPSFFFSTRIGFITIEIERGNNINALAYCDLCIQYALLMNNLYLALDIACVRASLLASLRWCDLLEVYMKKIEDLMEIVNNDVLPKNPGESRNMRYESSIIFRKNFLKRTNEKVVDLKNVCKVLKDDLQENVQKLMDSDECKSQRQKAYEAWKSQNNEVDIKIEDIDKFLLRKVVNIYKQRNYSGKIQSTSNSANLVFGMKSIVEQVNKTFDMDGISLCDFGSFDAHLNRGIVATKNFEPNQIIHVEYPLLATYDNDDVCVCCARLLSGGGGGDRKKLKCIRCGETFCSKECQKESYKRGDHYVICKIMKKKYKEVKSILMEKVPEIFATTGLMFLKLFGIVLSKKDVYPNNPMEVFPMNTMFRSNLSEVYRYSEEEDKLIVQDSNGIAVHNIYYTFNKLLELVPILCSYPNFDFNTYLKFQAYILGCFHLRDDVRKMIMIPYLYNYINHSCDPNVEVKYAENSDGEFRVDLVTLKRIEKGEQIKMSYIDNTKGYVDRQKDLAIYGFVCKCKKCLQK